MQVHQVELMLPMQSARHWPALMVPTQHLQAIRYWLHGQSRSRYV